MMETHSPPEPKNDNPLADVSAPTEKLNILQRILNTERMNEQASSVNLPRAEKTTKVPALAILPAKLKTTSMKLKSALTPKPEPYRPPPLLQIDNQLQSRLFTLPAEIRDLIWELAVSHPTDYHAPAHFHIYEDVYDRCTYDPSALLPRPVDRATPFGPAALLSTCRAAYIEATQYLYDKTHFQLVLFAGHARPRPRRLKHLANSFGELQSQRCYELLRRMRHITIIVQPGPSPSLPRFSARIHHFLEAIEHGKNTHNLALRFNFHRRMAFVRSQTIMNAFSPLARHINPSKTSVFLMLYPLDHLHGYIPKPTPNADLLVAFAPAIGTGAANWIIRSSRWEEGYCMQRGHMGKDQLDDESETPEQRAKLEVWMWVGLAAFAITAPVSVPALGIAIVRRGLAKGESWGWLVGR